MGAMYTCVLCARPTLDDDAVVPTPSGRCICLHCYSSHAGAARPMSAALRRELEVVLAGAAATPVRTALPRPSPGAAGSFGHEGGGNAGSAAVRPIALDAAPAPSPTLRVNTGSRWPLAQGIHVLRLEHVLAWLGERTEPRLAKWEKKMRTMTAPLDLALGSLLALAAFGFGIVGFIAGLLGNSYSTTWYVAALILGVLAGGVLLDEASTTARDAMQRLAAWLGTLFLLGSFAMGVVGFVIGLRGSSHAMTWLISSLVLAILSLAATIDEVQSWRATRTGIMSTLYGLGFLF